ncbi:MFS transporter [Nitrospirillum viridazoti]|uniref:ACS family hexuronate transporter-like MFS transporter n=2 Tax=Nitrospirillum TaxID=1543705 RepID=A0A560IMX5_9PROT|nr:MFS transporter [Nitrospirillum amazonense]TWB59545.1 ACS family hexuronate transporter-like MFS transporter [Nitrospirillum amazonense]
MTTQTDTGPDGVTEAPAEAPELAARRPLGWAPWLVLACVFAATALNYADRQSMALLKPLIDADLGWAQEDYGLVMTAFQAAGMLALVGAGWFIDRVGLRWGYPLAVAAWSLAAMAHAGARTTGQFLACRLALGVAEAANTPAAAKAVARWFPADRRSIAIGLMNAAPNVGAVATPLILPWLALEWGWHVTFFLTGAAGLIWLAAWFLLPSRPRVQAVAAPVEDQAAWSWRRLLTDRHCWAVAGAKFLTDPVWWFMLLWMPDFFHQRFDLDMRHIGAPVATVYALATVGALLGGIVPARLLAAGVSPSRARWIPMAASAVLVLPLPLALWADSPWPAVLLVGLVLAAHQGFSTNVFALAADAFPVRMVGTAIGVGAFCGNLGGVLILQATSWLSAHGGYHPLFIYCAAAYGLAFLLVRVLIPRVRVEDGA